MDAVIHGNKDMIKAVWRLYEKVIKDPKDLSEVLTTANSQGFTIAIQGPGSPGNETTYFGNLTIDALIKFQDTYKASILTPVGLTKGTGYFGPSTRKKVEEILR